MYLQQFLKYIWYPQLCIYNSNVKAFVSMFSYAVARSLINNPDSKVHGANMGPIWGGQDPGGPHVCPTNFAIWEGICECMYRSPPLHA